MPARLKTVTGRSIREAMPQLLVAPGGAEQPAPVQSYLSTRTGLNY